MRTGAAVSFERNKLSVFFSYAHADETHREARTKSLAFLKISGLVEMWHDRKIMPGEHWSTAIDEHLERANIILLLISPDFADSNYCWHVETKRALERGARGEALVIPVMVRPVDGWEETPIGQLQALPTGAVAVTSWRNRDEAYQSIAKGLRDRIASWPTDVGHANQHLTQWYAKVNGRLSEYDKKRVNSIAAQLRKAANSLDLDFVDASGDSAVLRFRSPRPVFDTLKALHTRGQLQQEIDAEILDLDLVPGGAVLRIESRIVEKEYRSEIHYLPELFGGRSLDEGFPPLVGGIVFPLNNPIQIGWSLLSDSSLGSVSLEEQHELQGRLARYLNTFLVVTGEHVNVDLNPMDDYCGVPPLIRQTELGRDLLAQDIVLKHTAASLLHPLTASGKAFWSELDRLGGATKTLESCFRVWIVPADATVREHTEGDQGHVTIEKLGLKVLCDSAYETLRRHRRQQNKPTMIANTPEMDSQVVASFSRLIVPEIQREVSIGPRFGLLRQILSVMIISKWIKESQLGAALKQAGFAESNNPEKYRLNVVDVSVLQSLKQAYLQMFGDGMWQWTRTHIRMDSGTAEKRLYVAGGIEMDWVKQH